MGKKKDKMHQVIELTERRKDLRKKYVRLKKMVFYKKRSFNCR
jgi:hypothetical protein